MTTEAVTTEIKAEIIEYDNVGMLATSRCDRCNAQAYVEVLFKNSQPLLFCASHYRTHKPKLVTMEVTIADHTPFLIAQETGPRDAASAAN